MATKRTRRKYKTGRCYDCGRTRNVTEITFWLNGYRMLACAECIKPYRARILRPICAGQIIEHAPNPPRA